MKRIISIFIFIGLMIPIIGEVLIVLSSAIFFGFWYIIISDLIKVYKKKQKKPAK
mgnify:CR=1 FL=1